MSKIVNLKPDYLTEYIRKLEAFTDASYNAAINLAAYGSWKNWNDSVKEGDTMLFTEEMLSATGDPVVNEVMKIFNMLRGEIAELKRKANVDG